MFRNKSEEVVLEHWSPAYVIGLVGCVGNRVEYSIGDL